MFFITDLKTLEMTVELLHLVMDDEELFASLLSLLQPTARNPGVTGLVAECKLVDVVMKFVHVHMPE